MSQWIELHCLFRFSDTVFLVVYPVYPVYPVYEGLWWFMFGITIGSASGTSVKSCLTLREMMCDLCSVSAAAIEIQQSHLEVGARKGAPSRLILINFLIHSDQLWSIVYWCLWMFIIYVHWCLWSLWYLWSPLRLAGEAAASPQMSSGVPVNARGPNVDGEWVAKRLWWPLDRWPKLKVTVDVLYFSCCFMLFLAWYIPCAEESLQHSLRSKHWT